MSVEQLKNIINTIDKLRVLFMLSDQRAVGRKKLSVLLEIGEGYVRNILSGLKYSNLVKEDRQGNSLTEDGAKIVSKVYGFFVPFFNFKLEGYEYPKAILVRNASKFIKMGIEERDAAIKMGALGAMIVTYESGDFWFPGITNLSLEHPELIEPIKQYIKVGDHDTIIITWGKTSKDSERGAINAAFEILGKSGSVQVSELI